MIQNSKSIQCHVLLYTTKGLTLYLGNKMEFDVRANLNKPKK